MHKKKRLNSSFYFLYILSRCILIMLQILVKWAHLGLLFLIQHCHHAGKLQHNSFIKILFPQLLQTLCIYFYLMEAREDLCSIQVCNLIDKCKGIKCYRCYYCSYISTSSPWEKKKKKTKDEC